MSEVVPRKIEEAPWGRSLASFMHRAWSGRLTVLAEERRFSITFARGVVVEATSPLATDAAVRVARISNLLSSTQVSEVLRRQAAAPTRDEIELIGEYAKLSADQLAQLRHRSLARRAARTFSLERGEVLVEELEATPTGLELDVRELIYLGARENMSELRLGAELEAQGTWFRMKPTMALSGFGFGDEARPVLDKITEGATLAELETAKVRIEKRLVWAVAYALTSTGACEVYGTRPAPVRESRAIEGDELAPRTAGRVAREVGDDELAPVRKGDGGPSNREVIDPQLAARPAARNRARDLVGVTIGERYVVEEKLGVGMMGTVYRAHHTKLTRLFALKVLHRNLLANDEAVGRFEREAALAGSLSHPNVIGVVDVGTTDGVPYLAMEHADGVPLATLLAEGPLEATRANRLLRQICAGLAYAHGGGIIHRDLKPENVIVETTADEEIPRIADFGTAILFEADDSKRLTAAGMVLGTPSYMAPEQAAGRAVDHRVDLYALGVIMYQMLSGVLPFTGSNVDIVSAALRDAPPAMSVRAPTVVVDPRLEALTYQLLAKKPEARPRDANAVKLLLELIELDRDAAAASLGVVRAPPPPVMAPPVMAPPVMPPPIVAAKVPTARNTPGEGTKTLAMWQLAKEPEAPVPAPPAPPIVEAPPPAVPRPLPPLDPRFMRRASGTALAPTEANQPLHRPRSRWPIIAVVAVVVVLGVVIGDSLLRSNPAPQTTREVTPPPVAPTPAAPPVTPTPPSASAPTPTPAPAPAIEATPQNLTSLYATVGRELQTLRASVGHELTEDLMRRYRLVRLKDSLATAPRRAVAMAVLDGIRADAAKLRDVSAHAH